MGSNIGSVLISVFLGTIRKYERNEMKGKNFLTWSVVGLTILTLTIQYDSYRIHTGMTLEFLLDES